MWGDFELLHFYPRNWQTGYYRSGHSLLIYISVWQYWLWFTFIFLINLYFIFLFRIFTFRRADIRGRRAVGDKRKGAIPEVFTCFFPFLWSLNILNNSLNIIKSIEVTGGYVTFTLQIIGFQWGWRYGYGELNYLKLLFSPIKIGLGSLIRFGKSTTPTTKNFMLDEVYFCRSYLRSTRSYPDYMEHWIKVPTYQTGLWISIQGMPLTGQLVKVYSNISIEVTKDALRLLRTTGVVVVPTRSVCRLLATSEDVTHSWAIPSLGIKLDCVPGRLFVSFINIVREGVYYGQCSELCGWNHYNMPIVLYALPFEHFMVWWEVELHTVFTSSLNTRQKNYSLLNVKYK